MSWLDLTTCLAPDDRYVRVRIQCAVSHGFISSDGTFLRRVLEDVMEMWSENVRGHPGKKVERERSIKKMFLRGDSVILVLLDPK